MVDINPWRDMLISTQKMLNQTLDQLHTARQQLAKYQQLSKPDPYRELFHTAREGLLASDDEWDKLRADLAKEREISIQRLSQRNGARHALKRIRNTTHPSKPAGEALRDVIAILDEVEENGHM